MSLLHSDNAVHRGNLLAAEQVRQATAGTTAASVKAADIAFYRSALSSAKANGCGHGQFVDALRELGTGGT